MKCFIPRVLKAGVWYVGEQEDSSTCLCLCRNQQFRVEKSMKAMQDLTLEEFEEDWLEWAWYLFNLFWQTAKQTVLQL